MAQKIIENIFIEKLFNHDQKFRLEKIRIIFSMTRIFDRYFQAKLNGKQTIEIENARKYLVNLAPKSSPSNCVQCSIGSKYPLLGIDVNGDIYPCDYFWGKKKYLLGNIFTNSLASVVNQPIDFRSYRNIDKISRCSMYNWRRFCGGGCPGSLILRGQSVGSKSAYCGFNKAMLEYVAKRIPLLYEKSLVSDIVRRKWSRIAERKRQCIGQ